MTYEEFSALALQPHDDNNIYIRGITNIATTSTFSSVFSLRAIPNELILWPQTWNTATALGPGPLVVSGDKPSQSKPHPLVLCFISCCFRGGMQHSLYYSPSGPCWLRLCSHCKPSPICEARCWCQAER